MTARIEATYRVRGVAADIAARAQGIAVEQSVEMPLDAITEERVLREVVGEVHGIADLGDGSFAVRIGLAVETVGLDAGQLLNMLFGNTSLHEDVALVDMELPPALAASFAGPNHGEAGMRARIGAPLGSPGRALTCSAIKPQGAPIPLLAHLAGQFALGGIDWIKDDHGMADQDRGRFAHRMAACAAAVRVATRLTGHPTRYAPSLSGTLETMRRQLRQAREAGLDSAVVAPMVCGLSTFHALVREHPDFAFLAHPSMGGAARIAPALLIGKLFRLLGADAVVFPSHGGRFGYTSETCTALAGNARADWHGLAPAIPVPAGGMTLARVPEILDFYGPRTMVLIGGSLLEARDRLADETAAFTRAVAGHQHGS
jgi:ribulose-bisphosphate carboxylase large chain